MEVCRFDFGHDFPVKVSSLIFYSAVAYEHYVAGGSGVGKSLEVALVLIAIAREDLDVSDEMTGVLRKCF